MKKPIIGISASIIMIETGSFRGRERAFAGQDYVKAISLAGGIPLILPILNDEQLAMQQLACVDGLLLTGGYDVHPFFYQEEPQPLLQSIYPERDSYEILLSRAADQQKKPILGICRGLQILNVAFGGTLYQDIQSYSPGTLQHFQQAEGRVPTHAVDILEGSLLKEIMGEKSLLANSFHHQAVKDLAPTFRVSGKARDGMIEAIEKVDHPYILGVQWHPELMLENRSDIHRLFKSFVEASLNLVEAGR